jgi:hypothetical protein
VLVSKSHGNGHQRSGSTSKSCASARVFLEAAALNEIDCWP